MKIHRHLFPGFSHVRCCVTRTAAITVSLLDMTAVALCRLRVCVYREVRATALIVSLCHQQYESVSVCVCACVHVYLCVCVCVW